MLLELRVIGNLGRDAVVKQHEGKDVLNFSLAHTEKWKNAQGVQYEKTTWVECSMWDKGNMVQWLKQGQLVHVVGTPTVNAYTTKETGELKATQRLTVRSLQLLGGAKKQDSEPVPSSNPKGNSSASTKKELAKAVAETTGVTEPLDDLPF